MSASLIKIGNAFFKIILLSPIHGIFSKTILLLTVTGKKSGKKYTTPVGYAQDGDTLRVTSTRERWWWRNLRGGAPVKLSLRGKRVESWGTVAEDEKGVEEGLVAYIERVPQYARNFGVRFSGGKSDREDIARASKDRVIVTLTLKQN